VKELNATVSQWEWDTAELKAQISAHIQAEEGLKEQIGVERYLFTLHMYFFLIIG